MTSRQGPDFRKPGASTAGVEQAPRTQGGVWYFLVTILSAGFLAAVPFWHAASRLGRPSVRRLALLYTAADIYLVILMILTPPQNADGSSGNETISLLGGFSVLAIVVIACVQLSSLRREVYGQARRAVGLSQDPAIARALEARARREEARRLVAQDPALARELGIGRPDLGREYDDGGLVDINTAPVEVIAGVCEIDRSFAESIVAGRAARGGYFNVGELLIDVSLPPYVQDQVRERATFRSPEASDAPVAALPLSLQKPPSADGHTTR
jgi:DNA uptake protein ComE-like DNA-binding protein